MVTITFGIIVVVVVGVEIPTKAPAIVRQFSRRHGAKGEMTELSCTAVLALQATVCLLKWT